MVEVLADQKAWKAANVVEGARVAGDKRETGGMADLATGPSEIRIERPRMRVPKNGHLVCSCRRGPFFGNNQMQPTTRH